MKRLLLALVLMVTPAVCAAENVTVWDFMEQEKVEGWNTFNIEKAQLIPQGLSLTFTDTGQIVRENDVRHPIEEITIQYVSPTGGTGIFFWQAPGMEGNEAYQIPITFTAAQKPQRLVLNLSQIPEWDSKSHRLGMNINGGTQILLQKVELSGPSLADKVKFPLATLFKFDSVRPYSVNFLWGPLMTFGEDQLAMLFTEFPPVADSWNKVLYAILAVAFVICVILKVLKHRKPFLLLTLIFSVFWIAYDLRMGAEIVSYAKFDIDIWWSKPPELQDFRDRGSFTGFTKMAVPYTEGKEKFVFVADRGWPFLGAIRYEAYPALPVGLDGDTEGIDTWLVYRRPDITQAEDGTLTLEGETISPPGDIVFKFEPGAFIFQTR